MRHWSVDEKRFRREDPLGHEIWALEQRINFGIGKARLDSAKLKKHWHRLRLDPDRRRYLELLLWGKTS